MTTTANVLQTLGLENLATVLIGWNPKTNSIPAIPAAIVVFVSSFVIGQILSNISRQFQQPIRDYVLEFIKTITLCVYPFGFGIIRTNYGETGFIICVISVLTVTLLTLKDADGNPIVVWIKYFAGIITLRQCLIKMVVQIAACLAAFRLGILIMNLELHPAYLNRLKAYNNQVCGSALNASLHVGVVAEMIGVVHVTWVSSQKLMKNPFLDLLIKVTNLALTLSAGSGLTGMFLNPANATCHTYGCGNTSRTAHILVYWAGPLVGTWFSVQLQKRFSIGIKSNVPSKSAPKTDVNAPKTDASREKRE